ncbi:MAG: peptidoglycan-associated lipoprotein Pal [Mariprofundaceae bacterium]|nr:peptidoglycan-associated lipoprotein Pal [Mariprofundaceae bacterium]
MNKFSKFTIAALAAAALLSAGCAKKEVVSSEAGPSTQPVRTTMADSSMAAEKPSSNAVYFAFDKSDLDAASRAILDANAAWLSDNDDITVTVEGNCDERGSREYNLALGQRRADSVKDYLVANGVDASRIDTVSFGEERPACKGSGRACWAQNRRADIVSR